MKAFGTIRRRSTSVIELGESKTSNFKDTSARAALVRLLERVACLTINLQEIANIRSGALIDASKSVSKSHNLLSLLSNVWVSSVAYLFLAILTLKFGIKWGFF